jgi:hypothetical protein
MTGPAYDSRLCERARQWVSLHLDGELSEFELALLDAHLLRCSSCSRFSSVAAEATARLRAAPREQLERPVRLPSRVRPRVSAVRLGIASAAALAATSVGIAGALLSNKTAPLQHFNGPIAGVVEDDIQLARDIRRAQLVVPGPTKFHRGSRA